MTAQPKKCVMSYRQYDKALANLIKQLSKVHYDYICPKKDKWTHVVGVAESGLPIAVAVAKNLQLPLQILYTKRNDDGEIQIDRIHSPWWRDDGCFKRLLVVDDIVDSGKTMFAISKHLSWIPHDFAFLCGRKQWKENCTCGIILSYDDYVFFPYEVYSNAKQHRSSTRSKV
jgi:orotate phosphoribosyltransferase-like protein